jgi:hypothetical protein
LQASGEGKQERSDMKFIGIDISRREFDLCLLEEGKVRSKVFGNSLAGHQDLLV